MILSQHVYNFLSEYLKEHTTNYLEIGVFNGHGLATTAKNFPMIKCEAVDPFIEDGWTVKHSRNQLGERINQQLTNAQNAISGLSNVNLNIMTSKEYFQQLTPEKIQSLDIGVVLIDGSHHYADVVNDYQLAMALIGDKSGLIIFDDINIKDVKHAYNLFVSEFEGRIEKQIRIDPPCAIAYIKEIDSALKSS